MNSYSGFSAHRPASETVSFQRPELNIILSLYGRMVAAGEWRDYAIDFNGPVAVFSIFRHTHETPLFAVAKRRNGKHFEFIVRSGRQTLKRCRELSEALKTFDKPVRLIQS